MERTWMPTVAGILDIVSGALGLIGGIVLAVLGAVGGGILKSLGLGTFQFMPLAFLLAVGAPLVVLGMLAVVGGIYALQRKIWGLALADSISAVLFSQLLGIPAIIFTALSKNEFA